jgi:hypothetical protein
MITTMAKVKTVARGFNLSGPAAPTNATAGELGDIYLDIVTGLSYELTDIITVPTTSYVWSADTRLDDEITLQIDRAELNFLQIRGIDFAKDNNGDIIYPGSADLIAAEMVCYLMGIGRFSGRGMQSSSLGGRSGQYEAKLFGYPISIVGSIARYHGLL